MERRYDAGGGRETLIFAGAVVKIFVLFRLDRQKWTRQGASGGGAPISFAARYQAMESTVHHALTLVGLVLAVIVVAQF